MNLETLGNFFTITLIGGVLFTSTFFLSQSYSSTTLSIIQTPQLEQNVIPPIKTESRFSEKLTEESKDIPKKIVYKDDPEIEAGVETVVEEGLDGKTTKVIKITYYEGKEYGREIIGTETISPKDKIISRGTKIIWKELDSTEGQLHYWKKIRVWATHYDSHCPNCNEWTATGMKATKGVIAVDPKVIKLGTKVYIPGYGPAIAGDTGGTIKGNIIDLCFEDAKTAGWWAHFVDIYLLN